MKYNFKRWIVLVITTAIFAVLLTMVDLQNAKETLSNANILLLIYAGFISLWFPVLCAIRWQILCSLLNAPLRFWESFQMIMAAWPLAAVTPAKSGDLIKVVFLQDKLPFATTTGVVLAERVVDVMVLCLYALLFGWWYSNIVCISVGGIILCGAVGFFIVVFSHWLILIPAPFREKAANVALASKLMCSHPMALFWIITVTALNWFLSFYQTWICYQALNTDVPLTWIIAALPVAIFAGLLPITPAGMGTRDSAMMALFHPYAPAEINLSIGILYSIYGYWLLSMIGIPFMRSALNGAIHHISAKELLEKIYKKNG